MIKLVTILYILIFLSMQRDLGEFPEVARCEPMRLNEWQSFLDDAGRVTDVKKLHDRIFRGVCTVLLSSIMNV